MNRASEPGAILNRGVANERFLPREMRYLPILVPIARRQQIRRTKPRDDSGVVQTRPFQTVGYRRRQYGPISVDGFHRSMRPMGREAKGGRVTIQQETRGGSRPLLPPYPRPWDFHVILVRWRLQEDSCSKSSKSRVDQSDLLLLEPAQPERSGPPDHLVLVLHGTGAQCIDGPWIMDFRQ